MNIEKKLFKSITTYLMCISRKNIIISDFCSIVQKCWCPNQHTIQYVWCIVFFPVRLILIINIIFDNNKGFNNHHSNDSNIPFYFKNKYILLCLINRSMWIDRWQMSYVESVLLRSQNCCGHKWHWCEWFRLGIIIIIIINNIITDNKQVILSKFYAKNAQNCNLRRFLWILNEINVRFSILWTGLFIYGTTSS